MYNMSFVATSFNVPLQTMGTIVSLIYPLWPTFFAQSETFLLLKIWICISWRQPRYKF